MQHDVKGRVFLGKWEFFIQALILVSLVDFALETIPGQSDQFYAVLNGIEWVTVAAFSIEYVVRLFLSKPPQSYAFSFFGLVDLFAILPFYLSTGLDLRSLRAIRLLRLFRLFKLARYSMAMQRFQRAFLMVREELLLFGVTALIIIFLASVGIYYFEADVQPDKFSSIFHAMWWAVSTLTTVGYGDIYPVTTGGKIFTFFVLITGLGIVAVPTGLFASALSKTRDTESEK